MVIRAEDRVADVLNDDENLVEVFASVSSHFERLRIPAMRRVMARLVTVGQAARVAGIEVDTLLDRLNEASRTEGGGEGESSPAATGRSGGMGESSPTDTARPPPHLASLPSDRITDLDVRDDLRRGEEPFSRIMAAKGAVPPGSVFRLRAIFEPIPLYHVLGKQGFAHWTEQLGPEDWRVWFYRADELPDGSSPGSPAVVQMDKEPGERRSGDEEGADSLVRPQADVVPSDDSITILDVRGLEPPEPMMRTLAALESLPEGATLVQLNVRVPQFLLPRLEELGYRYEIREQGAELVRLFIRRA